MALRSAGDEECGQAVQLRIAWLSCDDAILSAVMCWQVLEKHCAFFIPSSLFVIQSLKG